MPHGPYFSFSNAVNIFLLYCYFLIFENVVLFGIPLSQEKFLPSLLETKPMALVEMRFEGSHNTSLLSMGPFGHAWWKLCDIS